MRKKSLLLCVSCLPLVVQGQLSHTNYALPGSATEVTALVIPNGDPGNFALSQGGNVPSEAKATCDNRADSSTYKSTVGFMLERYAGSGLQNLKDKIEAYKMLGGFGATSRSEYEELGSNPGSGDRFARKSAFKLENLGGAEAASWTVVENCIQEAKDTATVQVYNARLVDGGGTWLEVRIRIYASSPEQARQYASEIIAKVRGLDYASVK